MDIVGLVEEEGAEILINHALEERRSRYDRTCRHEGRSLGWQFVTFQTLAGRHVPWNSTDCHVFAEPNIRVTVTGLPI